MEKLSAISNQLIVIPAQAGIQRTLYFLDSGSRQPQADSAGMTARVGNEFMKNHPK